MPGYQTFIIMCPCYVSGTMLTQELKISIPFIHEHQVKEYSVSSFSCEWKSLIILSIPDCSLHLIFFSSNLSIWTPAYGSVRDFFPFILQYKFLMTVIYVSDQWSWLCHSGFSYCVCPPILKWWISAQRNIFLIIGFYTLIPIIDWVNLGVYIER